MRLRASLVSLIAIALLDTAVSPRSAEASCEYRFPCDELSGNCVVCTYGPDEPSTVQPYESDGSEIEANIAQHVAADIAFTRLNEYTFTDAPRPDVARSGTALHTALDVDDEAWGAIVDDLFARGVAIGTGLQIDLSTPSSGVEVPADQGIVRAETTTGDPVVVDAGGELADPVDPVTGEFAVEHVDLAFPSFGVSFAHHRV
jgi:hypothetical protein